MKMPQGEKTSPMYERIYGDLRERIIGQLSARQPSAVKTDACGGARCQRYYDSEGVRAALG